jgi:cystathionine beta-lyase
MDKAHFDQITERTGTASLKWDRYPSEVLPMWIADMDFPSPAGIQEALIKRVEHGVFGYTHPDVSFKEVIISWYSTRHGWQLEPDWIVFMTGVVSGLNNFCQAFRDSYHSVVVQTPVYPPILHAPEAAGLQKMEVPFSREPDGRYSLDLDALEQSFQGGKCQFILCNPQNPTGRVFSQPELEAVADLCDRYDVVVCSDEIHSDLVFAPHRHIPFASLRPSTAQRTITFAAPSKTFNIAGLSCAFAIIPDPGLRETFKNQVESFSGHTNALGLTAGLAAYTSGGGWLQSLLEYLTANRQYLQEYVHKNLPGIGFYPPEGTYLAWLDFSGFRIPDPARMLLDRGGVALNPGIEFGIPGRHFVRLNFGCPRQVLANGLDRIALAVTKELLS